MGRTRAGLKTLEQATEIRRRILTAFERAENELDPRMQQTLLTFVVVGGGPTGVELAGAIADISRTALCGDFRRVDPAKARVVLVEAGPRILPAFSETLSARAARDLAELGVEVRTGLKVDDIDRDGVTCGTEKLHARSVFWAAGVQAARLAIEPAIAVDRAGRITVGPDCCVPGYPNTFVVGDMASFVTAAGALLPGVAPVAIQEGRYAAETILRDRAGRPRPPFRYRDNGQMATIGRSRAVVQTRRYTLSGRAAWLAWLVVHVAHLVGFRNRAAVLAQWGWNYLFSRRESRLITEHTWTPSASTQGRAADSRL